MEEERLAERPQMVGLAEIAVMTRRPELLAGARDKRLHTEAGPVGETPALLGVLEAVLRELIRVEGLYKDQKGEADQ
jgi:hypothetical protein